MSSSNGTQHAVRTLNMGIVGLGYWGPNLLRVLSEMPAVRVKWICDLDEQLLEGIRAPLSRRRPDHRRRSPARRPGARRVLIATPVFTHFDLASRALDAGKHTFVEKPLAPSASRPASSSCARAECASGSLMCGHTFLYSPPVRASRTSSTGRARRDLLHLVEPGEPRPAPAGRQRDLGPRAARLLDPALLARGDADDGPRRSGATRSSRASPTSPSSRWSSPSGIVANVELSWLAPSKLRRTVIVGSKKMVVYDDGSRRADQDLRSRRRLRGPGDVRRVPALLPHRRHPLAEGRGYEPIAKELDDFCMAIRDGREDGRQRPSRQGCGATHRGRRRLAATRRSRDRGPSQPALPGPDRRRLLPGGRSTAAAMIGERLAIERDLAKRRNGSSRADEEHGSDNGGRPQRVVARHYRERDAAVRRFLAAADLLGVITALARCHARGFPEPTESRLGPGAAPRLGRDLQGLRPVRPRHQADQPQDRRRPAVDLPRGPDRLAAATSPTTSCSPCTGSQLRLVAIFGVIAMLAVPVLRAVARRLAVRVLGARARWCSIGDAPEIATLAARSGPTPSTGSSRSDRFRCPRPTRASAI